MQEKLKFISSNLWSLTTEQGEVLKGCNLNFLSPVCINNGRQFGFELIPFKYIDFNAPALHQKIVSANKPFGDCLVECSLGSRGGKSVLQFVDVNFIDK